MNNNQRISDELERAEKEWGVGSGKSDFLKLQEGENVIRVLTPLFAYPSHYKAGACIGKEQCPECKKTRKNDKGEEVPNKPSVKFLCNVLAFPTQKDKDNAIANKQSEPLPQIKVGQFAYSIAKALQDLQDDPEWTFSEFPMPYNVKIKAVGAGTKEVEYSVIASPKSSPVPPEILAQLTTVTSPEQLRDNFKKAEMKKLGLLPKEEGMKVGGSSVPYPTEEINPEDIPF